MRKWRKYYVKRAKYFAQYLYNFINFFSKKREDIQFIRALVAIAPIFARHIDVYGDVLLEKWILNNAMVYACVWSIFFAPR